MIFSLALCSGYCPAVASPFTGGGNTSEINSDAAFWRNHAVYRTAALHQETTIHSITNSALLPAAYRTGFVNDLRGTPFRLRRQIHRRSATLAVVASSNEQHGRCNSRRLVPRSRPRPGTEKADAHSAILFPVDGPGSAGPPSPDGSIDREHW